MTIDLALIGGRVLDPETGVDAVRNVGIAHGTITAVQAAPIRDARASIDVSGLVVAPGFIDMHSHAWGVAEHRLQALDGVTTALELEAGAYPVAASYDRTARDGRPLNYGFSASWAGARMSILAGLDMGEPHRTVLRGTGDAGWQRSATPAETARILDALNAELADGALGIGILLGYAPGTDPTEYLAVMRLAAAAGCLTYTHVRALAEVHSPGPGGGPEELVRAALETGAATHLCHVNSVSGRHIDRVLGLLEDARSQGAQISTEAYPYGAAMTAVGAAFLAPQRLHARGRSTQSLIYLRTGERIRDAARLAEIRAADPGGSVIDEQLLDDDPRDRAHVLQALSFPSAVIASDAIPLTWAGPAPDPLQWPLPAHGRTHPRTAGSYSRTIRMLTRDAAHLELLDVVGKCSYEPARLLGGIAPAMRRKGRVQIGCDADLAIFDAATITDNATYQDGARPSTGVRHVFVGGTPVVRDGDIVVDALAGRPVRAAPR